MRDKQFEPHRVLITNNMTSAERVMVKGLLLGNWLAAAHSSSRKENRGISGTYFGKCSRAYHPHVGCFYIASFLQ